MKTATLLLLAAALLTGCATSTIETRKQERYGAYSGLAEDTRKLVDQGNIKVGMPMDAVYIAWGKPSQILNRESSAGSTVTWLYHGTYVQEHRYWSYRRSYYGGRCVAEPFLDHDYIPLSYVSAEIVFENGVVKEWRSLPRPTGY